MSKHGLHGHYDKLEPEERFRLDVLATARGDAQESERLVRTCNRRSYVMNDAGFVERWRGAIDTTLRVYIPLGEQLAKLRMVDAFRVFVPYSQTLSSNMAFDAYFRGHESGSRHAWAYAGKGGAPPPGPTTDRTASSWCPKGTSETPPWSGTRRSWRRRSGSTGASCRRC